MILLEKIDHLMKKNSLNKRQLAIKSGIPYTTIDGLYKGRYENMKLQTFKALCSYFGVTMDSMAFDDREIEYVRDREMSFSSDDAAMIRQYRDLDSTQQAMIRASLDAAHADSKGDAAPASAS